MAWIQTDMHWSIPTIRVVITQRAAEDFIHPRFQELCAYLHEKNPDTVAAFAQSILCTNQAIKDAMVVGMSFLFEEWQWSFVLAHPLFPHSDQYEKIPVAYLAANEAHQWILWSDDKRLQGIGGVLPRNIC